MKAKDANLCTSRGTLELDFGYIRGFSVHRPGRYWEKPRLTAHHDEIFFKPDSDGRWLPSNTYGDRRDQTIVEEITSLVNAWAEQHREFLRRDMLRKSLPPDRTLVPGNALSERADWIEQRVEAGLFDFEDDRRARGAALQVARRLRVLADATEKAGVELTRILYPELRAA